MARIWIATQDDLTCDYCADMDGQVIKSDEEWMVAPGDVHPNCRCEEFDLDILIAALGMGAWVAGAFDKDEGQGAPPKGSYEDIPSWEYEAQYDGDVPDGVILDGGTESNYSAYALWN